MSNNISEKQHIPTTKTWSFDEGPCPCTNGNMRAKSLTKTRKKSSPDDPKTSQQLVESNNDNFYAGEGDSLLIADLSKTCTKVDNKLIIIFKLMISIFNEECWCFQIMKYVVQLIR